MLVPEKIAFCLQCSGTKYRYFIWAKLSTAWRAGMVHSARSIALLLASLNAALPCECEKPSWIDWTIEISPWGPPPCVEFCSVCSQSTCRIFEWAITQPIVQCARRSLTSYRPVMHTCSYFGARVRHRNMPRGTARALQQVPQHFDNARANGLIFMKHLVQRKSQWPSGIFFLLLAQKQVQICFRSPHFAQR